MKISSEYINENNLHVATIRVLVDVMGGGCSFWLDDVKKAILTEYQTIREALRIVCESTEFVAEKEFITEDEILMDFIHAHKETHEDEYYLEEQVVSKFFNSTVEIESKL